MSLIQKPFGFGLATARAEMSEVPQSNLVVHSRADSGVTDAGGGLVSEWENTAGANWFPRGTTGLSAVSTNYSPTIVPGGDVGTLSGAGYIQFPGIDERLVTNANVGSQGSNESMHMFGVIYIDTWRTYGQILNTYGGGATHLWMMGADADNAYLEPACDGAPYPQTDMSAGEWFYYNTYWADGAGVAYVQYNNGAKETAAGNFGAAWANSPGWSGHLDLFASEHNAGYVHGRVAEQICYSSEQTGSTLTAIEDYINGQYGLW
jgi:hypothetical protein|tara:strand:- start:92 stop:880 length:789 start_codon:yes stop_codon:yes gene_type:complete